VVQVCAPAGPYGVGVTMFAAATKSASPIALADLEAAGVARLLPPKPALLRAGAKLSSLLGGDLPSMLSLGSMATSLKAGGPKAEVVTAFQDTLKGLPSAQAKQGYAAAAVGIVCDWAYVKSAMDLATMCACLGEAAPLLTAAGKASSHGAVVDSVARYCLTTVFMDGMEEDLVSASISALLSARVVSGAAVDEWVAAAMSRGAKFSSMVERLRRSSA
jgi:hypothetical protein